MRVARRPSPASARSTSISIACSRSRGSEAAILRNDAAWVGPGHGSVVAVGAKHYFVYHAWKNDGTGGNAAASGRQILVDEITWGADGWPKINDGTPSNTSQIWPGEAR